MAMSKSSDPLGVSVDTLRRWEVAGKIAGKIKIERTPGGHRPAVCWGETQMIDIEQELQARLAAVTQGN